MTNIAFGNFLIDISKCKCKKDMDSLYGSKLMAHRISEDQNKILDETISKTCSENNLSWEI